MRTIGSSSKNYEHLETKTLRGQRNLKEVIVDGIWPNLLTAAELHRYTQRFPFWF